MGKIWDYLSGKTEKEEMQNRRKYYRNKYMKIVLEEYEGSTFNEWIKERAEHDLQSNDNRKKYMSDLKLWWYEVKEIYNNSNLSEGIKIGDKDFPLIYALKSSKNKLEQIGFGECNFDYDYGYNDLTTVLMDCPDFVEYEKSSNRYANSGYDKRGYDKNGYDREGYDRNGYDEDGYDRKGFNRNGCDREGYDRDGFDNKGYDRDGYDRDGYDKDGYDSSGYDSDGYDIFGNHEDDWD